jgi:pimeloyl-ACP methyl ester carboxylesterase
LTCRVSNAYAFKKLLPKAELEVFSDSGHCLMFEEPERLAKILC